MARCIAACNLLAALEQASAKAVFISIPYLLTASGQGPCECVAQHGAWQLLRRHTPVSVSSTHVLSTNMQLRLRLPHQGAGSYRELSARTAPSLHKQSRFGAALFVAPVPQRGKPSLDVSSQAPAGKPLIAVASAPAPSANSSHAPAVTPASAVANASISLHKAEVRVGSNAAQLLDLLRTKASAVTAAHLAVALARLPHLQRADASRGVPADTATGPLLRKLLLRLQSEKSIALAPELAMCFSGAARLQSGPGRETLVSFAGLFAHGPAGEERLRLCPPAVRVHLLMALAHQRLRDPSILQPITAAVLDVLLELSGHQLSQVTWALARLGVQLYNSQDVAAFNKALRHAAATAAISSVTVEPAHTALELLSRSQTNRQVLFSCGQHSGTSVKHPSTIEQRQLQRQQPPLLPPSDVCTLRDLSTMAWGAAKVLGTASNDVVGMLVSTALARHHQAVVGQGTPQSLPALPLPPHALHDITRTGQPHARQQQQLLLPQDLANLAWALVTVGRHQTQALQAVSELATAQLQSLDPQALSNLLWACSKQQNGARGFVTAAYEMLLRKPLLLRRCECCHLVMIAAAISDAGCTAPELFEGPLAKAVLVLVPKLRPYEICNILHAYSVQGVRSVPVLEACTRILMGAAAAGPTQQVPAPMLSKLVGACAQLCYHDADLWKHLAHAVAGAADRFRPRELAVVAQAFGSLAYQSADLYKVLARAAVQPQALAEFTPKLAVEFLHGLVRGSFFSRRAFAELSNVAAVALTPASQPLSRQVLQRGRDSHALVLPGGGSALAKGALGAAELAAWAYCLARFHQVDSPHPTAIAQAACQHTEQFSPSAWVSLLSSLASLRVYNPMLLLAACSQLQSRISGLSTAQRVQLMVSMAELGHLSEALCTAVCQAILPEANQLSPGDMAEVSWAVAAVGYTGAAGVQQKLLPHLLHGVRDIPAWSLARLAWALSSTGLLKDLEELRAGIARQACRQLGVLKAPQMAQLASAFSSLIQRPAPAQTAKRRPSKRSTATVVAPAVQLLPQELELLTAVADAAAKLRAAGRHASSTESMARSCAMAGIVSKVPQQVQAEEQADGQHGYNISQEVQNDLLTEMQIRLPRWQRFANDEGSDEVDVVQKPSQRHSFGGLQHRDHELNNEQWQRRITTQMHRGRLMS